ncbi:DUF1552 domain-containing protein [Bythopirellula polymerisocia]|uniref:DUF1552 domain-containing protein n=1 Tax=Bythopirellula polymerisocia TaxID=2528003 RepID=UPI0018D41D0D|nr:DUF1552 domain-containing protein [Bythopirellula polymerisocia]
MLSNNVHSQVNRRHFLRNVGVNIALPGFVSFGGSKLFAAEQSTANLATTASGAPLRTAFIYFPNGAIPAQWWPAEQGSVPRLAGSLAPLDKLKQQLQILGGLDQVNAEGGADGAGDHARGSSVFLTGVRLNKSATDIRAGVSIDQAIAEQAGQQTLFPSLEMTCDAQRQSGSCDSGYACAYQFNISWKSPTQPMPPESNPRLMFERLFGSGHSEERAKNLARRRVQQQSILDYVLADAREMHNRLAARDREKLDQYLNGVREIEQRLERAERLAAEEGPQIEAPAGISQDIAEHVGVTFDMLLLAFQSDLTRVATLMLAHDGSNRAFDHIGITEGHHDLSHHQNNAEKIEKIAKIDRWYVEQFAKFLDKLQNTPDTDGNSLLHNSMIVYGSGNADGNRHTHSNLPIVLAGGGGGSLTPGRYQHHGSQPLCNLYLTLADRMGVQGLDRFGDSTGRLEDV